MPTPDRYSDGLSSHRRPRLQFSACLDSGVGYYLRGSEVKLMARFVGVGNQLWYYIPASHSQLMFIGNGTFCLYEELEPGTEYELRLRLKWDKDFGPFGSIEAFETPQEPDTAFDLHKAIKFEDIEAVQRILGASNAKVEVTDQMDYTPLMAAVSRNSKTIINILLGAEANVNTANKLGKTALMLAANKGFIDVVDILIKRGASVDAKDIHGMTALFYAVDGEFSNVVRTLVRAGACIDEVDYDNQYTPLIRLGNSVCSL
ncbi:unnamed protein product [Schistocephalus solidus]|uniref:ANK_REP_REGION domain-containing protein n=1 Tax=Schistocephalus solidus TaxID=70667 RepID=A0A183SR29_SCHSO|nr:unnamed protein product [Schistocephalus solidus]